MGYAVAKPFKSVNRKFFTDDPIAPGDIAEGSALGFVELKDGGFIVSRKANYDAMTKAELDALALERHVDVSAAKTKADVIECLQRAERLEEALVTDNFETLLKADLEKLATDHGLDISEAKTKADLIVLLRAHPTEIKADPVVPPPPSPTP